MVRFLNYPMCLGVTRPPEREPRRGPWSCLLLAEPSGPVVRIIVTRYDCSAADAGEEVGAIILKFHVAQLHALREADRASRSHQREDNIDLLGNSQIRAELQPTPKTGSEDDLEAVDGYVVATTTGRYKGFGHG